MKSNWSANDSRFLRSAERKRLSVADFLEAGSAISDLTNFPGLRIQKQIFLLRFLDFSKLQKWPAGWNGWFHWLLSQEIQTKLDQKFMNIISHDLKVSFSPFWSSLQRPDFVKFMKDSVLDRSLQNLPFFSPDKNMASNDVRSLVLSLYTFFKCLKITAPWQAWRTIFGRYPSSSSCPFAFSSSSFWWCRLSCFSRSWCQSQIGDYVMELFFFIKCLQITEF